MTADRIEAWKMTVPIGNRSKAKVLTVLNGVLKRVRKVHKLSYNPMTDVEKPRYRTSTSIEVFSVEEIWALVRAAESEQDAAIFLTAAFTGLRAALRVTAPAPLDAPRTHRGLSPATTTAQPHIRT